MQIHAARAEPARTSLSREPRGGAWRAATAVALAAMLAACQTTKPPAAPGNVSRLPPGNEQRDGPEAHPPPNLEAVPDAVPQVEPLRIGGPNKPYQIDGKTYVPLTDDRAVTEKGLASWYGKKFHGHRTASGEAYNMYAMTAAHKTLPIPSYARVRNPANGKEVIVRVNDRGPFAPGRVIDLSYTAALRLGVLGGVQQVEVTRITDDDIRAGNFPHGGPVYASAAPAGGTPLAAAGAAAGSVAVGDLDKPASVAPPAKSRGWFWRRKAASPTPATTIAAATPATVATVVPAAAPTSNAPAEAPGRAAAGEAVPAELGTAAATDAQPPIAGATTTIVTESTTRRPGAVALAPVAGTVPAGVVLPPADPGAAAPAGAQARGTAPTGATTTGAVGGASDARTGADAGTRPESEADTVPPSATVVAAARSSPPREERARADTTAGIGFWVQLGAFGKRDGALDFQRKLVDEQPWLAPLLAVFADRGLNKLQAGPYPTREEARGVAVRVREALHLVPTIVEKR
ncbi:MAG: septal ring lytic transglycosylase RlpA family protein [Burkholderiaceae bacterium]